MKRYSIIFVVLAALLLISASASYAVFPTPDGTQQFAMNQGWNGSGVPVWYICTDTSNIQFATTQRLTLAPNLRRGFYGAGVAAMFIVVNSAGAQLPIFETVPGQALYSGIWRVRLVTWTNLSARAPLTSIGQILAFKAAGDLNYVESDIRVDYPIVAVGRFANPPGTVDYVIPQAIAFDTRNKTVTLPTWNVYGVTHITNTPHVRRVIIPDAVDSALAGALGANIAPALNGWGNSAYQLAGTQRFWVFRGPKPVVQYPVVEDTPTAFSVFNSNQYYSPVGRYTILQRNISPATTITNPNYIDLLLDNGGLTLLGENQFINAPQIPPASLF